MSDDQANRMRRFWDLPDEVDDPLWAARRRLSRATRGLMEACLRYDGEAAAMDAAAAQVEVLVADLPLGPSALDAFRAGAYFERPLEYTDRSVLMGHSNPFAPPMEPTFEEGISVCELVLPERFVGAPGMAHGGLVAACFDQICGHRVAMAGAGGFTTRLTITYRRPVPVHVPVRFTCELVEERPNTLRLAASCARVAHADETLAEARATFVLIPPDKARALISGLAQQS